MTLQEPSLRELFDATEEPSTRETVLGCGFCLLLLSAPFLIYRYAGAGGLLACFLWFALAWVVLMAPLAFVIAARVNRGDTILRWRATVLEELSKTRRSWYWTWMLRVRTMGAVGAMVPVLNLAQVPLILWIRRRWAASKELGFSEGLSVLIPRDALVFAGLSVQAALLGYWAERYPVALLPCEWLLVVLWVGTILGMVSLLLPFNGMREMIFRSWMHPLVAYGLVIAALGAAVFLTAPGAHAVFSGTGLDAQASPAGPAELFSLRYQAASAYPIFEQLLSDPLRAVLTASVGLWYFVAAKYLCVAIFSRRSDQDRSVVALGLLACGFARSARRVARQIGAPQTRLSIVAATQSAEGDFEAAVRTAQQAPTSMHAPSRAEPILAVFDHSPWMARAAGFERVIEQWLASAPPERSVFYLLSRQDDHLTKSTSQRILTAAAERGWQAVLTYYWLRGQAGTRLPFERVCALDPALYFFTAIAQTTLLQAEGARRIQAGEEPLKNASLYLISSPEMRAATAPAATLALTQGDLVSLAAAQTAVLCLDAFISTASDYDPAITKPDFDRIAARRAELLPEDLTAQNVEAYAQNLQSAGTNRRRLVSQRAATMGKLPGLVGLVRQPERILEFFRIR